MLKREILNSILETGKKFKVEKIILFGSYAKGTETRKSDLDIIFIKDTKKRFLDRIYPIFKELAHKVHIPLELFVYTPSEFKKMQEESKFIKKAVKEGKVLYEYR